MRMKILKEKMTSLTRSMINLPLVTETSTVKEKVGVIHPIEKMLFLISLNHCNLERS